jgi:acyl transferase domain-containing protein
MSSQEIIEVEQIDGVAIIGMTGRFPGAKDIDQFWMNLRNGVESIQFFSDEELLASGVDHTLLTHPNYVRANAPLDDIDLFDASFFGYTPREAQLMDPQQRLFLECAWEALEETGYNTGRNEQMIGVFAGVGINTYLLANIYPQRDLMEEAGDFQVMLLNDKDFLSTRTSYKLNLKGPSITVQTACSTSLVAIHLACQSLLNYQSDLVLAGGVSISVPQKVGYLYEQGGIGSPDGHCRAFDVNAQGTVGGDGVGVIVLKRLTEAVKDGDTIHAVIKGSALNNDGADKVGYTAPSIDGQAGVIAEALAVSGVGAETISYVEAHGTGTSLGDPIEIAALTQAFQTSTDAKQFCAIGSLKTNIGHLDTASGVAGVIKTVLALKHQCIPPSLNIEKPNPVIDFINSPFYVNRTAKEWIAGSHPRRAGVSSFGIGGTNAHIILEEAPAEAQQSPVTPKGSQQLLLLSAKTESALHMAQHNLAHHLKLHPDLSLADISYTLQTGRREFNQRAFMVAQNVEDAALAFETGDPQKVFTSFQEQNTRSVVFLFPGQGSQYVYMGKGIYETVPYFREQIDQCAELLQPYLELDLRNVLYPSEDQLEDAQQQLNQTYMTQPALFVLEYALAKVLLHWGISPRAMIGHSIGEYVAACLAGVFTLDDALSLVVKRGQLMQHLPSGAMLSVSLSEREVEPFLYKDISIAALNAPQLTVLSGPHQAIEQVADQLTRQGITHQHVHTSHAFHSVMMEPAIEAFSTHLKSIRLSVPQIPYLSNVTGTWITAQETTDPSYWVKHLRQTVRFAENIEKILQEQDIVFLEIGPGKTLSTFAMQQQKQEMKQTALSLIRHPQERLADETVLLNRLGQLWLAGLRVDWYAFHKEATRCLIPLPTYPFERQRYWIDASTHQQEPQKQQKSRSGDDILFVPQWKQTLLPPPLSTQTLANHRANWWIFADTIGSSAALAERLLQAGQKVVLISQGKTFEKLKNDHYLLHPLHADDYRALVSDNRANEQLPDKIVHMWEVNASLALPDEENLNEGFYSLLYLVQALSKEGITTPIEMIVVSNDIYHLTGFEAICPEKAPVLGLCKVIPQEYAHITCRHIDVLVSSHEQAQMKLHAELLFNDCAQASSDKTVAYRGNLRWIQTFEPLHLQAPSEAKNRIREHGVYLITGGLGNVGLALANGIAEQASVTLVLTRRTPFPERDTWSTWLDEHDETTRKIQMVQAIEKLGSRVVALQVDVSQSQQVQTLLNHIEEQYGPLNGVIHAAGSVSGDVVSSLEELDQKACEKQFQAKLYGVRILYEALREHELDFCLLISSLASILGGLGFAAYAAANSFMDVFVQQHAPHARSWTSINWDGWQFEENDPSRLAYGKEEPGLLVKQGQRAFLRIITQQALPQVVVSATDLSTRIERWVDHPEKQQEKGTQSPSSHLHNRPDLPTSYTAPTNDTERSIVDIWQKLLGIEPIGIHDNFFELGGHSLLGTQLLTRLRDLFQVDLPLRTLFEAPTVAELSIAILEKQVALTDNETLEQLLTQLEELPESGVQTTLTD